MKNECNKGKDCQFKHDPKKKGSKKDEKSGKKEEGKKGKGKGKSKGKKKGEASAAAEESDLFEDAEYDTDDYGEVEGYGDDWTLEGHARDGAATPPIDR